MKSPSEVRVTKIHGIKKRNDMNSVDHFTYHQFSDQGQTKINGSLPVGTLTLKSLFGSVISITLILNRSELIFYTPGYLAWFDRYSQAAWRCVAVHRAEIDSVTANQ